MQPRSLLGGDVEENLITLCNSCHRRIHGLNGSKPLAQPRGNCRCWESEL